MNFLIFFLILTSHSFSTTQIDSSKIDLPEIEIYGGIEENSISTNIDVLDETLFSKDGNNNFQDLIQSIPSLHYAGGTSRAKYFQLRGLGELSQFSGEGPPHFYVGYIVDNIDFSGIGMIGKLYDFEQIEIFKGPQTASYGPNSMAGLINLVSKKPLDKKTFNFNSSIYSNNGQSFNLSTSIPITDNFLTKITLSNDYSDGFITNISDPDDIKYDTNSKDENLAKFQMTYNPSSILSFDYTYYNIRLDNKYDVWTPDNNGFISYSDYQGLDNQKTKANSLKINLTLDDIKLTLISTYSKNDILYSYDGDWANDLYWLQPPFNFNPNVEGFNWSFTDLTNRNRESFSQEIRVKTTKSKNSSLILGLFYSQIEENDFRNGYLFSGYANNIDSKFDINNYAFYTKFSYFISSNFSISSTLRFDSNQTKQDLSYEYYDYVNYPYDYYYFPQNGEYQNSVKDNLIGGNILFNYKVNDLTFINASLSRGYKTSGINQTQAPFLADSLKIYDTEFCNNIDLGFTYAKKDFIMEFSAFFMDRENPQLRLSYQVDPTDPTSFDYATFNAKSGYNYGFELKAQSILSETIKLNSYFSYLKTYVSEFSYLETTYGKRSLAHAPNNKYGFGMDKDLSKFIRGLSFTINSNYVSSFYFEEQNNIKSKPYNLIDASLNYEIKNISVSLWAKNLMDEKYAIRGYQFILDPSYEMKSFQTYGDLRSVGITLDYNL